MAVGEGGARPRRSGSLRPLDEEEAEEEAAAGGAVEELDDDEGVAGFAGGR
jgi:hypothetical protein